MSKKLLPIIIIILLITTMFVFCGCGEETSPVDHIAISTLPQLTYYRGDVLNLDDAEITVYYENGKSKVVPLTLEMVSDFSPDEIGMQLLTILYDGATTVLKLNVEEAPILSIVVNSNEHKTNYIDGQQLSTENLTLQVNYINGFSKIISVTPEMVVGYDKDSIGEQQLIINYGGKSTILSVDVDRREIANVSIVAPNDLSYVVGQTLDLTGGYFQISYTDNTSAKLNFVDLQTNNDLKFTVNIENEESLTLTKAARAVKVMISYSGNEKLFGISVSAKKVTSLQISTQPSNMIIDGVINFGLGSVKVIYNNNEEEIVLLNSERITNNAKEVVDITKKGEYTVRFTLDEINVDCLVSVINAVESDIEIILPENTIYYQDTGVIDYTEWEYSIKLTNGSYKMLNSQGDTKANLTTNVNSIIKLNDPTGVADFTTNIAGSKTYKFTYKNDATGLSIDKLVVINVLPKEITSSVINLPTKTTYLMGDTLDLTGSNIQFTYNNGTISGVIALTRDMFKDEVWTGSTNAIGDNISVVF
ncbi:MAG: bacterial Ig-like domain-containing protein, partial [Clostridia bacterium]